MRSFAAALSEHPLPAHAVGEVAGEVLEGVGDAPDLALLFVTAPHAGAIEDAAAVVRSVLRPRALLACAAESVVGNTREVEGGPAMALWAGRVGPTQAFHLDAVLSPDGPVITGWPENVPDDAQALVLLADPFTFPVDDVLARLAQDRPGMPVVGGMASAARGPGGNRLVADGILTARGAVAAFLGADVEIRTVVSQGCRPIGAPFVVTRSEANIIYELGGKSPLARLDEIAAAASDEDRRLLAAGLQLGRVIDEHKADFGRGDFLVRNVLGGDRESGALAVGGLCEVGATVQFHVRDADTADEDLRDLLEGRDADGVLLFTCNGRGTRLFGEPHHDAGVLHELLGNVPVAGFFAAGEIGPVGGRNFLHGFTASVTLLRSRSAP